MCKDCRKSASVYRQKSLGGFFTVKPSKKSFSKTDDIQIQTEGKKPDGTKTDGTKTNAQSDVEVVAAGNEHDGKKKEEEKGDGMQVMGLEDEALTKVEDLIDDAADNAWVREEVLVCNRCRKPMEVIFHCLSLSVLVF